MDKSKYNRLLVGLTENTVSRFISVGRALSSVRLGHQLGLVISDNSLRLCLIKHRLHRSQVVDISTYPLDPNQASGWMGKIEAAAKILSDYFRDRNLKKVPVNIGLLSEDIAFRRMYLPDMPPKELSAAIMWEGEKLFPFEFNQCSVDYQLVDRSKRNDIDHVGVNIIAAKSNIIESVYDRFRAAGLKVGQIGFLPAFLAGMLSDSKSGGADEHKLILHLGDEQCMAIFVHNGTLEFFQQFVTRPQIGSENDTAPANLDSLTAELSSFIDLYNGQSFGNAIDAILISGRYAAHPETGEFIYRNLGITCRPATEEWSLPIGPGHADERLIADNLDVFLTAKAPSGVHPLAPGVIRASEERRQLIIRVGTLAALALITVSSVQIQQHYRELYAKLDLDSRKTMVKAIEESAGYRGYINLIGKLDRSKAYLTKTKGKHISRFHVLLKELSRNLPDHINLTLVNLDEEEGKYVLRLDGHVRLRGFSPEIILAEYMEVLRTSPFFENVTVSNYHKRRDQDQFDLTFQLEMDARV